MSNGRWFAGEYHPVTSEKPTEQVSKASSPQAAWTRHCPKCGRFMSKGEPWTDGYSPDWYVEWKCVCGGRRIELEEDQYEPTVEAQTAYQGR